MKHKVLLRNQVVEVDIQNDYYGAEYWDKVSSRKYEPDTVGFLEDNCNPNTDFLDIGTANGAMAMIAASLGAKVYAYEPDPIICEVAKKNFALNPSLNKYIELQNIALSDFEGRTKFGSQASSNVLSSIVTAGHENTPSVFVRITSLASELERVHANNSRQLVIKMDIEGAEWKIIQSTDCLESLKNHSALMLVAFHPGFYRPPKKKTGVLGALRYFVWQLSNFFESYKTFKKLSQYAYIQRTNLNRVVRAKNFALLVLAGYHEFIVSFK